MLMQLLTDSSSRVIVKPPYISSLKLQLAWSFNFIVDETGNKGTY